jgi:DGQHR domain-containing protein
MPRQRAMAQNAPTRPRRTQHQGLGKGRKTATVTVHALRSRQGNNDVYSFFMPGGEITRIADIIRVARDDSDTSRGSQRKEIRNHVRSLVLYLNQMNVLFPNAITLAFSPEVRFRQSRGPIPPGLETTTQAGLLSIPVREEGQRVGWIVDGQQRTLALARSKNSGGLEVPVVAFVSDNLQSNREQFILVNKARPLPGHLINELLPETGEVQLPKDLAVRRIPSELCNYLARRKQSPFAGLIRRLSDSGRTDAVVLDSAIIKMIRNSINSPLGALAPFKAAGEQKADLQAMFAILCNYWSAVKAVFPEAWGLPPAKSRLMHSAGIEAMGILMDKVLARHSGKRNEQQAIKADLAKLAPHCAWTGGTWKVLGIAWNEIQNNPKHIRGLADTLVRLYATAVPR